MRAPENSTRASSISCCRPIGSDPIRAWGSMSMPRLARCSRAPAIIAPSRPCRCGSAACRDKHSRRRSGRGTTTAPDAPCRCRRPSASRAERKCTSRPSMRHSAVILVMDAGDDLHQRRLAGAVFADEPVDLAAAQREIDVAAAPRRRRRTWRSLHCERRRHGDRDRVHCVGRSLNPGAGRQGRTAKASEDDLRRVRSGIGRHLTAAARCAASGITAPV